MCEYCEGGMAAKTAGEMAVFARGTLLPGASLSSLAVLVGFSLTDALVSWGLILAVGFAALVVLRLSDARFARRLIRDSGVCPMCGRKLAERGQ